MGGISKSKRKDDAVVAPQKAKRQRTAPPTEAQKDALLSFMERHTAFATNRIDAPNANKVKQKYIQRLEALMDGYPGEKRTGPKWWKCWTDMKLHAKAFAATNIKKCPKTGGGGPDESIDSTDGYDKILETSVKEEFTSNCPHVDRIMEIIGWHNAVGLAGVKDDLQSDDDSQKEKEASEEMDKTDDEDDDLVEIRENKSTSRKGLQRNSSSNLRGESSSSLSRISSCSGNNSGKETYDFETVNLISSTPGAKKALFDNGAAPAKSCCSVDLSVLAEKLIENTKLLNLLLQHLSNASVTICIDTTPQVNPSSTVEKPQEATALNVSTSNGVPNVADKAVQELLPASNSVSSGESAASELSFDADSILASLMEGTSTVNATSRSLPFIE